MHYDGTAWTPVPELDPKSDCHFWVWTAGDIWRACNSATGSALAHFDGQRWTDSAVAGIATAFVFGFWGSASNDICAATTAKDSVLHYDGTQWQLVALPQYSSITTLWGSGPADIWGVYFLYPYLLHYDGTAWSTANYGLTQSPHGVWGTGPQDVWVVGDHGVISHYDGTRWSLKRTNPWPEVQIRSMGGSSANDRWIAGSTVVPGQGLLGHYDGQAWAPQQLLGLPDPSQYTTLLSIWERAPDDLFVGSYQNGAPVLLHRGTEWSAISLPKEVTGSIRAVWGSGADELWVATDDPKVAPTATLTHCTGANWSVLSAAPLTAIFSIWGSGPDDIWFGGVSNAASSTGGMLHYDGKQLTYTALGLVVESISGTDSADIWATAGSSTQLGDGHLPLFITQEFLLHYDGQSWSRQAEPALQHRGAKGSHLHARGGSTTVQAQRGRMQPRPEVGSIPGPGPSLGRCGICYDRPMPHLNLWKKELGTVPECGWSRPSSASTSPLCQSVIPKAARTIVRRRPRFQCLVRSGEWKASDLTADYQAP